MILIRRIIASGYLLITLLISCIVYIWYNEWQEMETLVFTTNYSSIFYKQ